MTIFRQIVKWRRLWIERIVRLQMSVGWTNRFDEAAPVVMLAIEQGAIGGTILFECDMRESLAVNWIVEHFNSLQRSVNFETVSDEINWNYLQDGTNTNLSPKQKKRDSAILVGRMSQHACKNNDKLPALTCIERIASSLRQILTYPNRWCPAPICTPCYSKWEAFSRPNDSDFIEKIFDTLQAHVIQMEHWRNDGRSTLVRGKNTNTVANEYDAWWHFYSFWKCIGSLRSTLSYDKRLTYRCINQTNFGITLCEWMRAKIDCASGTKDDDTHWFACASFFDPLAQYIFALCLSYMLRDRCMHVLLH